VQHKRNNIYAYFGSKTDTKVLLTSHIDTVPPFFDYYNNDGIIYGRGSNDAKASVATQIISVLELIQSDEISLEGGDVGLLFVVGEEVDGVGMKFASENLDANWEHVVFGEPTELKLGVGHKGVYNFDLLVKGKASHSGYPQLGIDANTKLIQLLNKIVSAELPTDELLGESTINPGFIEAGVAANVISPFAKAKVLIRVAHDASKVKDTISSIVEDENQEHRNIELVDVQLEDPVYLDHEIPGFETTVLAYFTDVPHLRKEVQTKYLYGPGSILNAHTGDEHVSLDDLKEAVEGYKKLVRHLLSS
jgi:acetylornithine deacetylase